MTLELTPGMHHSGATGLGTGWWPSLGHGAGYRLMAPQGQRVLAPRGDLSLAWWSLVTRALWPQGCFMTPLGSPKRFVDEMSHQVGFVPPWDWPYRMGTVPRCSRSGHIPRHRWSHVLLPRATAVLARVGRGPAPQPPLQQQRLGKHGGVRGPWR